MAEFKLGAERRAGEMLAATELVGNRFTDGPLLDKSHPEVGSDAYLADAFNAGP